MVGRQKISMMDFEKIQLHKAGAVSATEEDAYWQIGFTDDAQNPATYLLVQNAFEFTDEERANGMDSHYVELNDQSLSNYGGIESVVLLRDRIYFEFTPETGELFELQGGLGLQFELSDADFDSFKIIAEHIFDRRLQTLS